MYYVGYHGSKKKTTLISQWFNESFDFLLGRGMGTPDLDFTKILDSESRLYIIEFSVIFSVSNRWKQSIRLLEQHYLEIQF